jgi:hypothetical protein
MGETTKTSMEEKEKEKEVSTKKLVTRMNGLTRLEHIYHEYHAHGRDA